MSWNRPSRQSKVAAVGNLNGTTTRIIPDKQRYVAVNELAPPSGGERDQAESTPADAATHAPVCVLPRMKYPLCYHRSGAVYANEAEQAIAERAALKAARGSERRRSNSRRQSRRRSTSSSSDDEEAAATAAAVMSSDESSLPVSIDESERAFNVSAPVRARAAPLVDDSRPPAFQRVRKSKGVVDRRPARLAHVSLRRAIVRANAPSLLSPILL
jgi:hypothetical protein